MIAELANCEYGLGRYHSVTKSLSSPRGQDFLFHRKRNEILTLQNPFAQRRPNFEICGDIIFYHLLKCLTCLWYTLYISSRRWTCVFFPTLAPPRLTNSPSMQQSLRLNGTALATKKLESNVSSFQKSSS